MFIFDLYTGEGEFVKINISIVAKLSSKDFNISTELTNFKAAFFSIPADKIFSSKFTAALLSFAATVPLPIPSLKATIIFSPSGRIIL